MFVDRQQVDLAFVYLNLPQQQSFMIKNPWLDSIGCDTSRGIMPKQLFNEHVQSPIANRWIDEC